ncbi:MAG TPA: hypothetical protein VNG33_05670 [Polyangiaceae bacterium]|nr:hypothetical protein [Polyangiaceae bacterium]
MTAAIQEQRRRLFLAEVSRVVPGLYGWLATVLAPVLQRGASFWSRASALLALAALVGSFVLSSSRPRVARWFGVYAFILFCFGTWAFLGALLRSDQLDAVRGALGAVGFLLHALAWGAAPKAPDGEALDNLVPGVPLQPRHKPARLGALALGLGIAVALGPMALAFGVDRPGTSLLAHALALGCGVLVIGASTDVALRMGKAHQFPAWRKRASRALWPLGGLIAAVGIGLIWLALR